MLREVPDDAQSFVLQAFELIPEFEVNGHEACRGILQVRMNVCLV